MLSSNAADNCFLCMLTKLRCNLMTSRSDIKDTWKISGTSGDRDLSLSEGPLSCDVTAESADITR